jgi:hypothetical protein
MRKEKVSRDNSQQRLRTWSPGSEESVIHFLVLLKVDDDEKRDPEKPLGSDSILLPAFPQPARVAFLQAANTTACRPHGGAQAIMS